MHHDRTSSRGISGIVMCIVFLNLKLKYNRKDIYDYRQRSGKKRTPSELGRIF